MERREDPTTIETTGDEWGRLKADFEDAVRSANRFFNSLAYLKQIAVQAHKRTAEHGFTVSSLLSFLPDVRKALKADNAWIMCRRSGSKSPYEVVTQYTDGTDARCIANLKPWTGDSVCNIGWVAESDSDLMRPAMIPPQQAQTLIKDVLSTEHNLIIAQIELGGMDHIS